jgi:hypothetical protein
MTAGKAYQFEYTIINAQLLGLVLDIDKTVGRCHLLSRSLDFEVTRTIVEDKG